MKINDILILTPIDFFFLVLAILSIFYTGFHYLIFALKKEDNQSRILLIGFACLFFGLAISRLINYFMIFQIKGYYIGHNFYIVEGYNTPLFSILAIYYGTSFFIGVTLFYYAFDKVFHKTYYSLTIISTTFIVISLFTALISLPLGLKTWLLYFSISFIISSLFLIFIWFIQLSDEEFQSIAIIILIGFIVHIIGAFLMTQFIVSLEIFPLIIPSIFIIISSIISIFPTIIRLKVISKSILLWSALIVILSSLIFISTILLIKYQLPFIIFIWIILIIIGSLSIILYSINRIYKNIRKNDKIINVEYEEKNIKDILKSFVKPRKIEESEILISKEKKICIVCKKKLKRFSFLCSGCHTFYCNKCLNTIVERENICWICNSNLVQELRKKI
ncbi:MAG: hypothetical protein ACTSR8_12530 [Promethearchaeota archaeon]